MATNENIALDIFLTFETADASHFNAHLFRLMHKADCNNLLKLSVGFPTEYTLYKEWRDSENPEMFYDKYNVRQRLHQ